MLGAGRALGCGDAARRQRPSGRLRTCGQASLQASGSLVGSSCWNNWPAEEARNEGCGARASGGTCGACTARIGDPCGAACLCVWNLLLLSLLWGASGGPPHLQVRREDIQRGVLGAVPSGGAVRYWGSLCSGGMHAYAPASDWVAEDFKVGGLPEYPVAHVHAGRLLLHPCNVLQQQCALLHQLPHPSHCKVVQDDPCHGCICPLARQAVPPCRVSSGTHGHSWHHFLHFLQGDQEGC
mmetsp:Transcript_30503/g.71316  ORF Transcript_30503/g.71316 Transcript_30503/m.71316 type:complete len:239 (+) Transcript_30503:146-862(+)